MAKQVKVFNGTASATMSQQQSPVYDNYGSIQYYNYYWPSQQTVNIYTVPSGRVAKIDTSYINVSGPYGIGAYFNYGVTGGWTMTSYSYGYSGVTSIQQGNYIPPYGIYYNGAVFNKQFYMNSGQSITLFGPASGNSGTISLTYNFMVVEEY